jgi:hypothetical protein
LLRVINPALAGRSCDLCRTYYFDEETGEPKKTRKGDGYELRKGKVPCEASIGCAKGHYNQLPDLNDQQKAVIDLYEASKVSGGSMLNEAEKRDWWLLETFARLHEVDQRVHKNQLDMIGLGVAWQKTQNAV